MPMSKMRGVWRFAEFSESIELGYDCDLDTLSSIEVMDAGEAEDCPYELGTLFS